MKFEYEFSQDIASVFEHLTDPQFIVDRSIALGALSSEGEMIEEDDRRELTLTRKLENDVPAFVAKIMGAEQSLEIKEIWEREGDDWAGTSDTKAVGKPVDIHVDFKLVSTNKGCKFTADIKAKVAIPLIGRKIEKFAQEQVFEEMTADMGYTSDQLSA